MLPGFLSTYHLEWSEKLKGCCFASLAVIAVFQFTSGFPGTSGYPATSSFETLEKISASFYAQFATIRTQKLTCHKNPSVKSLELENKEFLEFKPVVSYSCTVVKLDE